LNAVEIEEAITHLGDEPFDSASFPFAFLEAFGNKATTIKRLKSGSSNASDIEGGVLQRNNIHIMVCAEGKVIGTLANLKASPATSKAKAKFVVATDGVDLEAEDLLTGEIIACRYQDFPNHFGFFLPLAGITTVKQIRNNPIDIQATGRLNRLYVELLKDNEEWATEERRHDMNHFMARLIFCFFAEDTDIFNADNLFTATVEQMSDSRSENAQYVLFELFRAMDTPIEERAAADLPRWADSFPYVNGGLFAGNKDIPRFSRIARSYLLHAGSLDWKAINPDIFGSMIQAVADDSERGELGMHYTSVPNILKVLNPLFLDDLREQLEQAGDNGRKLLNLRKRIANIRVFDPACGSGNFLVIAYIQMREIEAEILRRRSEANQKSSIKLENFYGIELKDFAAEVARLSLLIAEFQCDVRLIGQKEAKALVLPLKKTGQIHQANALVVDWLKICPPIKPVGQVRDDISGQENLAQVKDTYVCGNPPYIWANNQTLEQKSELLLLQKKYGTKFKGLDYVAGWIFKYCNYARVVNTDAAFVATNSITQGQQVDPLWGSLLSAGNVIFFAYRSFKWQNLAKNNAGVSVVIIGITTEQKNKKKLFYADECLETNNISPYLLPMENVWVRPSSEPLNGLKPMLKGNQPTCGGGLVISAAEADYFRSVDERASRFIKLFVGSDEISKGKIRNCIWINDNVVELAQSIEPIAKRLKIVCQNRNKSKKKATRDFADQPHRFTERRRTNENFIAVQCVSTGARPFLTPVLLTSSSVISNRCFGIYGAPFWYLSILSSKLHYCWGETTSGKLKTDLNYSNTLTWNTFPIPNLTNKNKADLTLCAENILLAREAHFPATIADLYDHENMPEDLLRAHECNDEVLERIYIGRRFKNDTERLEKLFALYTKMTIASSKAKSAKKRAKKKDA